MDQKLEEMTNAQLQEMCDELVLEVEAKGKVPTKKELVKTLTDFKAQQDIIHGKEDAEESDEEETKVVTPAKPKQSKEQLMRLELFRKERVIVHDQQEAQTKDEIISVTWGNRLLDYQTDLVSLTGSPQYVRVGALNNLKEATTTIHVPKENGGVEMVRKPRFVIVPVEGLSDEELKELADKQKLRSAKYA